jgi:serine/threonine-protein kinase RsbW
MVVHGYQEANLSGDLTVEASLDDGALRVTIEDTARPFDPRTRLNPDHIDKPLDERPIGGLGIFLVMRSVDSFDYQYVDGRNRYVLTMKQPAA